MFNTGDSDLFQRIARRFARKRSDTIDSLHQKVITLHPNGASMGNVLLSYIINPFMRENGEAISCDHTHHWESYQIAQTFLDRGFSVDVISFMNNSFKCNKDYQFLISARTNLEKLAGKLGNNCTFVAHLDTAHWLSNNRSAYSRLLSLQSRRNITLKNSIRIVEPNYAIEHSHIGVVLGNEYTSDTYQFSGKPLFRIPISTTATYEWDATKNFERCRKNFLWFGSSGFVHKGLDLVLEAFAKMPDFHLTVCGPFSMEKEFTSAYRYEMFERPNIHAAGWVDVRDNKFREIVSNCVGLVYPSCAEGGGGSAITCMHAGIIPLLTREASVDIDNECGLLLQDTSVEGIIRAVEEISNLPESRLQQLARNAWSRARTMHTRERFASEYSRFVSEVLLS